MDRRSFLGLAGVGAGALAGAGSMTPVDGHSGGGASEFMPSPVREWDSDPIMPWWRGVPNYVWDADAGKSGRWVDNYLPDGLVGCWDFEDMSVNTAKGAVKDRSPGKPTNDGQIIGSGTPQLVDSPVGRGLVFGDGNTQAVRVPASSALDVQTGDFTLVLRFRTDTPFGNSLIAHKPPNSGDASMGYYLAVVDQGVYNASSEAELAFVVGDGVNDRRLTPTRAPVGAWLFVTVRYNAGSHTARIGMNGMPVGEHTFSAGIAPGTADVLFGAHETASGTRDRLLSGALSTVRIYDRELSDDEIRALAAHGGAAGPSFNVEFRQLLLENRTVFTNDPVSIHERGRDLPYLLSAWDGPNNRNILYESANLTDWSIVERDITGPYTLQDYVQVDGTYWVYDSDDSDTRVWSGPDFQNLSFKGPVLNGFSDVGAFYENGIYYLFPEERPEPGTPSGNRIGVWTSDRPDGGFRRQTTAIDFSDRPYVTGDADIEKINGTYWLFCDCETVHPYYATALAKSDDLLDWQFVTDSIKNHIGGDLDVLQTPDSLIGFTEFTEDRGGGIGLWDVTPVD